MITKEQLLHSMRHESAIIKHLATKVPADSLDYRPTPAQRSMLELMQYMTCMAIVPVRYILSGSWEGLESLEEEAGSITAETFVSEMDRQMGMIEEALADLDEAEAETAPATMPWGTPTTVSAALMDMVLKCFTAYRMQLFLYLKSCGLTDLGPAQCWVGVDPQSPSPE